MKTKSEWLLESMQKYLHKFVGFQIAGVAEQLWGYIKEIDDCGGVMIERKKEHENKPSRYSFHVDDVQFFIISAE